MKNFDNRNFRGKKAVTQGGIAIISLFAATFMVCPSISAPTSSATYKVTSNAFQQTFVNPKTGTTLWTANVQSAEANTAADGTLKTEMDGVVGVFYSQGKPGDGFTAAKVFYDDQTKTVTAHGGVTIRSLTQKSTTLTCDSVVWHQSDNLLIGSGHVIMHSGKFTQTGPSFQADTRLKDVVMRSTSAQRVHMIFQP